MSEENSFVKLRDILVYFYQEETDARRVVNDAGMNVGNISFTTKAINNWTAILLQARKEDKTAQLMAVIFKDYPENGKLSKAWHDYNDYVLTEGNKEKEKPFGLTPKRRISWVLIQGGLVAIILIAIGMLLNNLGFLPATPPNLDALTSTTLPPTHVPTPSPSDTFQPPTSSFTKTAEGWSVSLGDATVRGGSLIANPDTRNDTSYYVAPPKYHGNWRSYSSLTFDLSSTSIRSTGYYTNAYGSYGDVFLANGQMTAQRMLPHRPSSTVKEHFVIDLRDDGGWMFDGGAASIYDVLANVTDFQIRAEYVDGPDTSILDNVRLVK